MATTLLGLQDGEIGTAMVCFTDIAGFARAAESLPLEGIAGLLKHVCAIIARRVVGTTGAVVKYIGDASLLVFPEGDVDRSVRELLGAKQEIEEYFVESHPDLRITFSAHVGEIVVVRLDPIQALDVLGDSVNLASVLGRRAQGGSFVISRQVHQRLGSETRAEFVERAVPPVYVAEGRQMRPRGGAT